MEYLPFNLTSCIEKYEILPTEISYSILYDVALGLCYLHSQIPPIIHRDLSSNNVMLASNMKAKISDLGVAKILNLSPLQLSRMTHTPGTPAYMPPEVMTAHPVYNESVDEFSYGVLMVHVFSGSWPEPQCGPIHTESGKLIPVSEAEQRDKFLQHIGKDHPLMELILKCLNNDPYERAHINEIVDHLAEMVIQYPSTYASKLEMMNQIEIYKEKNETLLADVQQREQQKVFEGNQELEKYKKEIEALRARIALLNKVMVSDNDLITTAIQVLQATQDKKKQKLTEINMQDEKTVTDDSEIYDIVEANDDGLQQDNELIKQVRSITFYN